MYRVPYLGAQDSPPVNYQFIHILSRRVRGLQGHRGLALPAALLGSGILIYAILKRR
jgi:hypothetical protein